MAARTATRTKRATTKPTMPADPDLPIYSALVAELPLPEPFDIPEFKPWDGLLPARAVGTVTSEQRIVPVDDTGWTTQDAAALLAHLDANTDTALLDLTAEPVPQIAEVAR